MRHVAYGCSKLLYFYLKHGPGKQFSFIVDRNYIADTFCGVEVIKPDALQSRLDQETIISIFAVSNNSIIGILSFISTLGFTLGKNAFLYSDLFAESFAETVKNELKWNLDLNVLRYSTAYTLNSRKPIHTTICGSWLFLETLRRANQLDGDVAEVGAFEGGNALCALQSPIWTSEKNYFIFDTFEGFPGVSISDPSNVKRGDYQPEHRLAEILCPFAAYPEARIIKGTVPDTFSQLPRNGRYSLVFYDCDLYQPALDTFHYFWDRMYPSAFMIVHDYFTEPGGFAGVKAAADLFFADKKCRQINFWQNTMAVFIKE
jgi:Macrocin-O-methyltransferase (TylF)